MLLPLLPTVASAAPVISVDADPTTVGVQSVAEVALGDSFAVDILIGGVDSGQPLNGFEFDLFLESSVLSAVSVVDGGFLPSPVFVVQADISSIRVEFAEVSLLPVGASGDGVLASISFEAVGLGSSDLDLRNVLLTAPFGIPIATEAIQDGEIVATSRGGGANPIPEPSSVLYFVMGSLVLTRTRRLRSSSW